MLPTCITPAFRSAQTAAKQKPLEDCSSDMPPILTLTYWGGLILIYGFFGIVFWKLLTGRIILEGLLEGDIRDKDGENGYSSYVSPGRVQSLLITLFAALYYLLQVINNPKEFPEVPDGLVGALAASQALYLGGKAQAMLLGRLRNFLK